jgi:adenylosuccinate synthase
MPWHVALDSASERRLGKLQIGTTRRGIGPAYADKAARIGIRVQDILDPKILRQKFETALAEKNVQLERLHEAEPLEVETLADEMETYAARLRPYVADTSLLVDRALREGRRVLLEGAQGPLLDVDHGTYPFVTSSNPVAGAAATGVGIGPTRIDGVLGVAKAYVTRVGEGPFPTEIEGRHQARVRELGAEYGTTTGRERRCGWLDLVGLRFAAHAAQDRSKRAVSFRIAVVVSQCTLPKLNCRIQPAQAFFDARCGDRRAVLIGKLINLQV